MSGDHNMYQKTKSYLDDFECPRCGHCCQALVDADDTSQERVDETVKREHEWVGLTEEEIVSATNTVHGFGVIKQRDMNFAKAVEQALKEKNHG
jgi:hypothetical protein